MISLVPDPSPRRAADARSTWSLQRLHRLPEPEIRDMTRVAVVLRDVRPGPNTFAYRDAVTHVRPTAAMLLNYLWRVGGESMPIEAVCLAVYQKPVTLRAVRQTIFRANRALERTDCPLAIHCRGLMVFVRYKPRPQFSRVALSPAGIATSVPSAHR